MRATPTARRPRLFEAAGVSEVARGIAIERSMKKRRGALATRGYWAGAVSISGMRISLTVVSFLFLMAACSDKTPAPPTSPPTDKSMMDKAGDLARKVGSLDAIKQTCSDLAASLKGITDGPTATKAKGKLSEITGSLRTQLDGKTVSNWTDKLGSTGQSMLKAMQDKVTKLAQDPEVQKAVGPVLAELKGLLGT
jgi:hypothetical protein